MRIVTTFQYFPETKHSPDALIVLDSEGDIWLRYGPCIDKTKWTKVALPIEFFEEDEEDNDAIC